MAKKVIYTFLRTENKFGFDSFFYYNKGKKIEISQVRYEQAFRNAIKKDMDEHLSRFGMQGKTKFVHYLTFIKK